MKKLLLALLAVLALLPALYSQEFRGAFSGVASDATGASVAGAKVTVVEVNTGTRTETVTDNAGHYNVPFLLPGDYDIKIASPGFKEYSRKAIHLGAGENPVVDAKLEVGDATQTMEVTDVVPMINSESASIGQAITTAEVEDLPSNGGTPMMVLTF